MSNENQIELRQQQESLLHPQESQQDAADPADTWIARVPWVDCARVFLDFVMVLLLFIVVIWDVEEHAYKAGAGVSNTTSNKTLHIHEMPIYVKTDMSLGPMWTEAEKSEKEEGDGLRLAAFQEKVAVECTNTRDTIPMEGAVIEEHPMCVCIMLAEDEKEVKNCMLQNPFPSVNRDWSLISFSSAAVLWFITSLAMSVGTLPYVRSYMTWGHPTGKTLVYKYDQVMVIVFVVIDVCMLVMPLIITAIQFPQNNAHIIGVLMMMMWSGIALLSLGMYNYKTLWGFFSYHRSDATGEEERTNYADRTHMSSKNWIVYGHLLVSAPAIAIILHLTQQWMEYHTIVNTTLIFSAIFAVDGFSQEMANYWLHQTYVSAKDMHDDNDGPDQGSVDASITSIAPQETRGPSPEEIAVNGMHTSLGLMRMFAIVVNAVMLALLYTLAYPLTVDNDESTSPIFAIVVILYSGIFLLPDLAREFSSRVSFSAIEFRQYGDFLLRVLTLVYVWRASAADRER